MSSRAVRVFYNYLEPGSEPDPGGRRGHTRLFYDPGTGRLHNEAVSASGARWSDPAEKVVDHRSRDHRSLGRACARGRCCTGSPVPRTAEQFAGRPR